MARIFVSYRHDTADGRIAARLTGDLARLGHAAFIDHQIPAGVEFDEHIGERLREADVFLLLVTRAAHDSAWVRGELRVAARLAATLGRPRIIPLVLESFADEWRMEWHVILDPLTSIACLDPDREWAATMARIARELAPGGAPPDFPARRFDRELIRLGVSPVAWRRTGVIEEAARRVGERRLPVVMVGLPGIGKTTLLHHVAMQLHADIEHVVVLPLATAEGAEPAFALEALNDFLTDIGRGVAPERLQRQPEARSLAELAAALADIDALVLVDAIERAPAAWRERILETLSAARVRVLATGRMRVQRTPASVITVPVLSADEAQAFVAHHARALDVDVDAGALLARLPESVRGHPQALSTIVVMLRDVSPDDLLGWGLPDDARAALTVVTAAVAALELRTRQSLALLAMLRGAPLTAALDAIGLRAPAGLSSDLSELLGRTLVYRQGAAYDVPAIVREALAAADAGTLTEALETTVGAYRRADPACSADILADVGPKLAAAATEDARWDLVSAIADEHRLEALNRAGHWTAYSTLLRLGIDAAREQGNRGEQVRLSFRLVRKSLQLGDFAASRKIVNAIGGHITADEETLERAELLSHRALLDEEEGDVAGALAALGESAALRERLGDQHGLAIVLGLAGHFHLRRNDHARARDAYEAAKELMPPVPSKEDVDVIWGLAMCALAQNDLDEAERLSLQALTACAPLAYNAGRPKLELILARVQERRGRLVEARDLAQAALARAEAFYPAVAAMARALLQRVESKTTETH